MRVIAFELTRLRSYAPALSFLSLLVSGCASNVIEINARDTVRFATAETTIPVNEDGTRWIRIRASNTKSDFTQSVPNGKTILITGTQIAGPTQVTGNVDLNYMSVSYGREMRTPADKFFPPATGSIAIGLALTDMDLTLIHQGIAYERNDQTTELYGAARMGLRYTPNIEGIIAGAFSIGPDVTGSFEADIRLDYYLFKHFAISGGYRWFKYNYYVNSSDSTIRIDFNGPFIGINIPF